MDWLQDKNEAGGSPPDLHKSQRYEGKSMVRSDRWNIRFRNNWNVIHRQNNQININRIRRDVPDSLKGDRDFGNNYVLLQDLLNNRRTIGLQC